MDKILKNLEKLKLITIALKSILKLVKLQSLVVKCEKYNPVKFANFVPFCITHEKLILTFFSILVSIFCA